MSGVRLAMAVVTAALFSVPASVSGQASKGDTRKMTVAVGTFEVKMRPVGDAPLAPAGGVTTARFSNEKSFSGDLQGTSTGDMLTVMTATPDSAGYVLVERVSGSLAGRTGTFVLQHSSTVARGKERQSIVVVPDSGTDGLAGISGEMTAQVGADGHRYRFEYHLPE